MRRERSSQRYPIRCKFVSEALLPSRNRLCLCGVRLDSAHLLGNAGKHTQFGPVRTSIQESFWSFSTYLYYRAGSVCESSICWQPATSTTRKRSLGEAAIIALIPCRARQAFGEVSHFGGVVGPVSARIADRKIHDSLR